MRPSRVANLEIIFTLSLLALACGRRGDPIPRPRAAAQAPQVRAEGPRQVQVTLPRTTVSGEDLVGVDAVRVLFLAGGAKPTPQEVFSRGEVVLERRRPDLPGPGAPVLINLANLRRPQGWIALVAVRVGNVPGRPSEVLPWADSSR
jgi:hypothetical protein